MNTAGPLTTAPERYADWLGVLETLRQRDLTEEECALLACGCCTDLESALPYLEQQLIETVNRMLKNCIRSFRRDAAEAEMYSDTDALLSAFRRFAQKLDRCAFFTELSFLPQGFRSELFDSLKTEAGKYWNCLTANLAREAVENNQPALEDLLYMIRRIRLFRKYEKSEK